MPDVKYAGGYRRHAGDRESLRCSWRRLSPPQSDRTDCAPGQHPCLRRVAKRCLWLEHQWAECRALRRAPSGARLRLSWTARLPCRSPGLGAALDLAVAAGASLSTAVSRCQSRRTPGLIMTTLFENFVSRRIQDRRGRDQPGDAAAAGRRCCSCTAIRRRTRCGTEIAPRLARTLHRRLRRSARLRRLGKPDGGDARASTTRSARWRRTRSK